MGKTPARKRKRQFKGNRFTKATRSLTASEKKLELLPNECAKASPGLSGNRIFDVEILEDVFSTVCCPSCLNSGLFLKEDSLFGLCSHFSLQCPNCEFIKGFSSSKKIGHLPEINTRLVYGLRQLGKGANGAEKLCSTLNLPPPPSRNSYAAHEKKLLDAVEEVSQASMINAAEEVKLLKGNVSNSSQECGISVDGTWQRRGYSSLNGCVSAISIDTGKVLDVAVLSAYCPTCKKIQKLPENEFEQKKADHVCQCNYEGSAHHMETVGASRIFHRSEISRGLKYIHYYGDGDSKGFTEVKDTYGKDSVTKFECIGHIQKRVGTHLRQLQSCEMLVALSSNVDHSGIFVEISVNY